MQEKFKQFRSTEALAAFITAGAAGAGATAIADLERSHTRSDDKHINHLESNLDIIIGVKDELHHLSVTNQHTLQKTIDAKQAAINAIKDHRPGPPSPFLATGTGIYPGLAAAALCLVTVNGIRRVNYKLKNRA